MCASAYANSLRHAPEIALHAARIEAGIEPERFRLLRPGEVWEVAANRIT